MFYTMRRIWTLIIFIIIGNQYVSAQNYPTYKITALDSESKGFYYLCPINGIYGKPVGPTHMILDNKGKVIYFKSFKIGASTNDFKVWPNGLMSYNYKGKYYLMDSSFKVVDSVYSKNGAVPDLHDMQILPNGHFLLMGTENVKMDLSSYHYFNQKDSPGSKNAIVVSGVIQEQDKNKNIVFEWHAKGHFAFDDVDSFYLNSPTFVDWTHFNAFEYDNDSNILLSVRWFDEITKINRKDGSIIWRMGGKRNQFSFVNDTNGFLGQHDIRRITNGNITMYDNGRGGIPFHPATAREYKLDETLHTATLVWSYVNDPKVYSFAIGNAQRLSNGNTLVDYGIVLKANQFFNVINQAKTKVFEIVFDDSLTGYRSFNYFSLPWKLNRPQITCSLLSGKYYLDAGLGYSKYLWSTGDTSRTIEAKGGADSFSVFVSVGDGGMIRSEPFITSDHTNPCSFTGIDKMNDLPRFSIFPNPVNDDFILESSSFQKRNVRYQVFDITGKILKDVQIQPFTNKIQIPVNDLSPGIYSIAIDGINKKFIKD